MPEKSHLFLRAQRQVACVADGLADDLLVGVGLRPDRHVPGAQVHFGQRVGQGVQCVFHMASALLIDKGFTSKTHSGVICLLGQEFATKGVGQR